MDTTLCRPRPLSMHAGSDVGAPRARLEPAHACVGGKLTGPDRARPHREVGSCGSGGAAPASRHPRGHAATRSADRSPRSTPDTPLARRGDHQHAGRRRACPADRRRGGPARSARSRAARAGAAPTPRVDPPGPGARRRPTSRRCGPAIRTRPPSRRSSSRSTPPSARRSRTSRPELVGNLDGAPIRLRYSYRANAGGDPGTRSRGCAPAACPEDRRARAKLRELDDPDRHFLLFDPAGDGRVAEVFGDLTSARHVAVVVPGMNNDLEQLHRRRRRARPAPGLAVRPRPGRDHPVARLRHAGGRERALGIGDAEPGAEALPEFVAGIRAQRAERLHWTVIGALLRLARDRDGASRTRASRSTRPC